MLDENLIDVETDKVVLELPAPTDGVLVKIVKNDGDSVTSGEVIAVIDTEAKGVASAAPAVAPAKAGAQTPAPAPAASAAKAASPSATKIAAEKGIDTSTVQGTGRDGRVTKSDVTGTAPAPAQSAKPAPAPMQIPTGNRAEQRVPMSK